MDDIYIIIHTPPMGKAKIKAVFLNQRVLAKEEYERLLTSAGRYAGEFAIEKWSIA